MSEIAHPERWTVFAFLLISVIYGLSTLVREWRRKNAEDRRRQRQVLAPWLEMSTEAQRAHDNAVLAASDAALQIVLDEAERVDRLYVEPMPSASSD